MKPLTSQAVPINPGALALLSSPDFGTSPWRGLSGGANPAFRGMRGYGCDCGPSGGCSCTGGLAVYDPGRGVFVHGGGMRGLGQNVSLDQLIGNAFSWLSGTVQTAAGPSAAVPTGVSSVGAVVTQLMQWAPYLIGGYIVYKLVK